MTQTLSCTSEKGQIMIVVTTDMKLPEDVDEVQIEVLAFGATQFKRKFDTGEGRFTVPATLAVAVGEDPSAPVEIRQSTCVYTGLKSLA